jgi:hypothetical protein
MTLITSKLDFNLRKKPVSLPAAAAVDDDSYHQQIGFLFKEETSKWSVALYGAETWILWKVDQKYLEGFEM